MVALIKKQADRVDLVKLTSDRLTGQTEMLEARVAALESANIALRQELRSDKAAVVQQSRRYEP